MIVLSRYHQHSFTVAHRSVSIIWSAQEWNSVCSSLVTYTV